VTEKCVTKNFNRKLVGAKAFQKGYISVMTSPTTSNARPGNPMVGADLQDVAHQVHQEFDGMLDQRAVDECLARMAAKFEDAKVRAFVPLLVRRYVRDELLELLTHAKPELEAG
jgi:hypothetical protein